MQPQTSNFTHVRPKPKSSKKNKKRMYIVQQINEIDT